LGVSAQCQALSLIEWSYSYVLTNQTHPLVIDSLVDAATANGVVVSEELSDIAAEALWAHAEDKSVPKKTVQSLWRLLHEVNLARYRRVLVETGPATGASEMQATARRLLAANPNLSAPEIYQRGTISLSAIKQQLVEDSLKAPFPDTAVAPISRLELQQSAEQTFELLGYPQAVDAAAVEIPLAVSNFRLSLFYRGQGAVVLQQRRITGGRGNAVWSVAAIVQNPLTYELDMPYVAFSNDEAVKLEVYSNVLLYGDSIGIRRLMMRIYGDAASVADPAVLDLAAARLANEYEVATDDARVETLSWISKTLALKGAGRYGNLLELVTQRAPSSKLRKYSAQKRSASAEPAEQFEPGKMDLAALRQAHPPLYAGAAGDPP
jgi:hypothetical protein